MKTTKNISIQFYSLLIFLTFHVTSWTQHNLISIGENQPEKFDLEHALEHLPEGFTEFQRDSFLIASKRNWENRQQKQQDFIRETLSKGSGNQLKSDPFNCNTANWGFENGNFINWNTSGCVSIVNSGTNPYSGNSNVYNGNGGAFSAQLSSDNSNACQDGMISRTINVPATGQTFFTFHFNLNIFNFPHSSNYAAKFKVRIYNNATGSGIPLSCPSYTSYYSYDQGPVGVSNLNVTPLDANFYNPSAVGAGSFNVSYTQNWNHVTMDLSSFAGQSISIFFIAEWCTFDVDWIYATVDMDCPINTTSPQPVCVNQFPTSLCAPSGLNASLQWLDASNNVIGTSNCVSVNNPGMYKLRITPNYLACNNQSNIFLNYQVNQGPTADFQVNDSCLYNEFTTTNSSLNSTSYLWNYGVNSQNSTNYLSDYFVGENSIQLVAYNGQCTDTLVKTVSPFTIPEAGIDILSSVFCSGENISIMNSSIGQNLSEYQWLTSNGISSNNEDLGIVSFPSGDAWIELIAINEHGCRDTVKEELSINNKPFADFDFVNTCLYNDYEFEIDPSSDQNLVLQWNFGDGSSSSLNNPSHQYSENLEYQVELIVENSIGCKDTIIKQALPYLIPEAQFSAVPACLYSNQILMNTSDISDDSPLNFEWDLGDGATSMGQNITHMYQDNGVYVITLIATSNHGCKDTLIRDFSPLNTPTARFVFDNECLNNYYHFQDVSLSPDGTRLNYQWNFGDGSQSNSMNPEHLYSQLGDFPVVLIVESGDHCSDTFQLVASPYSLPVAQFVMDKSILNEYDSEVNFTDITNDQIESWNWNFGDGNSAINSSVNHTYSGVNTYSIVLEVVNTNGCIDTTVQHLQLEESVLVYVPNTFSPNGDEHNNLFHPVISGSGIDFSTYTIQIFNRWGEVIWESNDVNDSWDGNLNDSNCQTGTYIWKISFLNTIKEKIDVYQGHVNLVR